MKLRAGYGTLALMLALSCSKPTVNSPADTAVAEELSATEPLPQRYEGLLRRFAEHDRLDDWSRASCESIGVGFVALSKRHERHTKKPLGPLEEIEQTIVAVEEGMRLNAARKAAPSP